MATGGRTVYYIILAVIAVLIIIISTTSFTLGIHRNNKAGIEYQVASIFLAISTTLLGGFIVALIFTIIQASGLNITLRKQEQATLVAKESVVSEPPSPPPPPPPPPVDAGQMVRTLKQTADVSAGLADLNAKAADAKVKLVTHLEGLIKNSDIPQEMKDDAAQQLENLVSSNTTTLS